MSIKLGIGTINIDDNQLIQRIESFPQVSHIETFNLEDYKFFSQKVDILFIYLNSWELINLEPLVFLNDKKIIPNIPLYVIIPTIQKFNKSLLYKLGAKHYLIEPVIDEELEAIIGDSLNFKKAGLISHSFYRDFGKQHFYHNEYSSNERNMIEEADRFLIDLNNKTINHSFDDIITFALEGCIHLTKSKIGYFHFVDYTLIR